MKARVREGLPTAVMPPRIDRKPLQKKCRTTCNRVPVTLRDLLQELLMTKNRIGDSGGF